MNKKQKNKISTILICALFALFTLAVISFILAVSLNDLRLAKIGFIVLIYIFGIFLFLNCQGGKK